MKPFHLEDGMKTMGGKFYPTGHMVLLFPGEQAARDAAKLLEQDGFDGDAIALLTPADFRTILGESKDDGILPSAGTEGDTARRFNELAEQGHHGLLVHAPHGKQSDRVMELLAHSGISYGQKYNRLVIEDLVE